MATDSELRVLVQDMLELELSVGGASVRFPSGSLPDIGLVDFELPGTQAIKMTMNRMPQQLSNYDIASLQALTGNWVALQTMSLWLFHTPAGAVPLAGPREINTRGSGQRAKCHGYEPPVSRGNRNATTHPDPYVSILVLGARNRVPRLRAASSRQNGRLLTGRCYGLSPQDGYNPPVR